MEANQKEVEISIDFNEFESMKAGNGWVLVFEFEKAIDIVRASKLLNVRLRQESKGSVIEWDNF